MPPGKAPGAPEESHSDKERAGTSVSAPRSSAPQEPAAPSIREAAAPSSARSSQSPGMPGAGPGATNNGAGPANGLANGFMDRALDFARRRPAAALLLAGGAALLIDAEIIAAMLVGGAAALGIGGARHRVREFEQRFRTAIDSIRHHQPPQPSTST